MGQKRRVLTPQRSAVHLWGSELRALRDELGLSLAALGGMARYDASYLGRLERGDQFPTLAVAQACDQLLGGGGELIRLWHIADLERRRKPGAAANPGLHVANSDADVADLGGHAASGDPGMDVIPGDQALSEMEQGGVTVPCRSADGRILWVTVPRRTFLLGGVAAATGAVMPGARTARRIAAAESGSPTPIEHLQKVRQVLIDADNLLGPRHIIPTVQEHIRVIQQLRAGRSGADRRALLHLQAEFAEFAGWLHQDSGDYRQAQYWLDRALEWSHAVPDADMAVYVMARKSQLAGDMRDAESAIDLADAADAMARPGSRLQATAQTYLAHGHALALDTSACLRALDSARDLAAELDDDGDSGWAVWLDGAYIDVQRARCLTIVGRHEQAAGVFEQAIRDLPASFRRDRGVYLARSAQAWAAAGEPDHAAAAGLDALAIAEETSSGRIVHELAELDGLLGQWSRMPAVSEFRDALTSVIPQEADAH